MYMYIYILFSYLNFVQNIFAAPCLQHWVTTLLQKIISRTLGKSIARYILVELGRRAFSHYPYKHLF